MLLAHLHVQRLCAGNCRQNHMLSEVTDWTAGRNVHLYMYLARIVRCQNEYNPIDQSRSSDLFALHELHVLV